jgi:PAS domain S-box-containing protein
VPEATLDYYWLCVIITMVILVLVFAFLLIFVTSFQRLRSERDFVNSMLKTTQALIMVFDQDGRLVRFNRSCEDLAGLPEEEMLGKPLHQLPCAAGAGDAEPDPLSGTTSAELPAETTWTSAGGEQRTIAWTTAPLTLSDTGEQGMIATGIDITERKRAEDEVKMLATAVEQAAGNIVITDAEGLVTYVNAAFVRSTGHGRDQMLGRNLKEFRAQRGDPAFQERIWGQLAQGEAWSGIVEEATSFETTILKEMTISPITNAEGKITGYVSVSRDITHERQLESQLRQAQKMEAIGTLAGGIAHDFNNMLAAILGFTKISLDSLDPSDPLAENLTHVLTASNRARDLVKQILTFSRRSDTEVKPVRVQLIVREVLKLLRASFPSTVDIRLNISSSSGLVLADPIQIHQVLMNLCTNAEHAMRGRDGVLDVSLIEQVLGEEEPAKPADLPPGRYLRLSVRDNGHGMDQGTRDRIFDPFFTTKKGGEGSGMGLSVVHGIVKNLGGTITVYSKPDAGTIFHVYLPRIGLGIGEEKIEEVQPPRGTERILFVDDEDLLARLGAKHLRDLGYMVSGHTNSTEALADFHQTPQRFDLVVTDQTMPNLTGTELARKIREVRPDLPVILITGFSTGIAEAQAQAVGVHSCLLKPVVASDLGFAVRRAIDGLPPEDKETK